MLSLIGTARRIFLGSRALKERFFIVDIKTESVLPRQVSRSLLIYRSERKLGSPERTDDASGFSILLSRVMLHGYETDRRMPARRLARQRRRDARHAPLGPRSRGGLPVFHGGRGGHDLPPVSRGASQAQAPGSVRGPGGSPAPLASRRPRETLTAVSSCVIRMTPCLNWLRCGITHFLTWWRASARMSEPRPGEFRTEVWVRCRRSRARFLSRHRPTLYR